jgi:hypothetical protein
MDGTIADLYGVEDWLPKLRSENTSPYSDALPIYNMLELSAIIDVFRSIGYKVIIVSWGSMGGSNEYTREVKKVKQEWLKRYLFPYDELHVIKYGTPKTKFTNEDNVILVDDSTEVINEFLKSKIKNKRIVNAKYDIISQLLNILREE